MPTLLDAADYQPDLARRHAAVAAQLRALWPALHIEAIGASAIPGACSKGDLDLLVLVAPEALEAARERLVAAGYREKTDTLRTAALCMLESPPGAPEHAVQLVAAGSPVERLFLGFRDRLRADPALVAAYNAVKRGAAGQGDEDYRAAKAAFIASVLGPAA